MPRNRMRVRPTEEEVQDNSVAAAERENASEQEEEEMRNGGHEEQKPPLPEGFYALEAIRKIFGKVQYLVKWYVSMAIDLMKCRLSSMRFFNSSYVCPVTFGKEEADSRSFNSNEGDHVRNFNNNDASDIVKIIRPVHYEVPDSDNQVLVTFAALRSDGKMVMVDNKYLKLVYPEMLLSYYESHIRYNV